MKAVLLLTLVCLPLAGLTAWSFVEALGSPPPPEAAVASLSADEARQFIASAEKEDAAAQPLLGQLERADLLSLAAGDLNAEASGELKEVVDAWDVSKRARLLAEECVAVNSPPLDDDAPATARQSQAETSLAKVRQFVASQSQGPAAKLAGAEALFKLLDRRAKQLQAEVARYRKEDNIMAALGQAAGDLEAGRYDDCLSVLSSAPLADLRSGELGDRAQLLRKRAEYRRAIEDLLTRKARAEADRDLFADIEAFSRKFSSPPSPAEAELRTRLMRKRDALQLAIAIADLANPPDLDTLLAQAAAIVEHEQVDGLTRQRIRAHVIDWLLEKGFPRLHAPEELVGKQEAVTKNEQRKIGVFFLPPGAEQWRFWRNRSDREQRPRGDEQIPRDSFLQPPSTPMYVAWAQGYNDESARLIKQGGGQNEWQEFARRCDERQQELTAYREKWGIDEEPDRSCRDWSFLDAAATARTVVERWRQFEQILGKST